MTESDGAAGGPTPADSEHNAENTRKERIRSLLEGSIPRYSQGGLFSMLEVSIPDFENIGPRVSLLQMKDRKDKLDDAIHKLSATLNSLLKLCQCDPKIWNIRHLTEIDLNQGLSFDNIVNLHGPFVSALDSITMLESNLKIEVRLQEYEMTFFVPATGRGRRRNAHAYLVAERLARYYYSRSGQRPTYGTDGNIPSTPYTRCLEGLFKILGINAGLRGPAEAACRTIKDEQDRLAEVAGRRNNG